MRRSHGRAVALAAFGLRHPQVTHEWKPPSPRSRMRAALGLAALLLAMATHQSPALAGEYTVPMGVAANCVNHSWTHFAMTPLFESYDLCGSSSSVGTLSAAIRQIGGIDANWQNAASQFTAPAGTYISHLKASYDGFAMPDAGFSSVVDSETNGSWTNRDGCLASGLSLTGCGHYGPGLSSTREWSLGPGTTVVGAVAICNYSQCLADAGSGQGDDWAPAWVEMHSAWVTVHEDATPTTTVTGGGLTGGGWLNGTQAVRFDSSDASGIRDSELVVDGHVLVDDPGGCDYTYAAPCPSVSGGSLSLDTPQLSNGGHVFEVSTENAAGNWSTTAPQTFYVNNTPPGEPSNVSLEGGDDWHTTNSFHVAWSNPPDVAPITTAYYDLCDAAGANCQQGSQSGTGIEQLSNIQVPAAGTYQLRIWLGDAGGLTSGAKTPFVTLRFDATVPGQASPLHDNGWVNAAQAASYDQQINPDALLLPPSGIAGYAVTTDGSDPGTIVNAPADAWGIAHYQLTDLPEGTTTLRARAISGAGIAATTIGSTTIQVDRTPPDVSASGAPDPNVWTRGPVTVQLSASDALSGMTPAPDPDPKHGGYVENSVDGAAAQDTPGGAASVTVPGDGTHTLTYQAFDVAGNGSGERSLDFKVDQTPPVAGFEAQDPGDPTKVSVLASDATSGLADGGVIELREVSSASGTWHSLATTHTGSRYVAHVDPRSLEPGVYAFRATVPDQAGNTTTTTGRVDDGSAGGGAVEQLPIDGCHVAGMAVGCASGGSGSGSPPASGQAPAGPGGSAQGVPGGAGGPGSDGRNGYDVVNTIYQWLIGADGRPFDYGATVSTRLRAGIVTTHTVARPRRCRLRRPARCGRRPALDLVTGLAQTTRIPFGRPAAIRGDLATAGGVPLSGMSVLVLQRYDAVGARWVLLRTLRTDANGGFSYRAPAGASRSLDFLYRGSSTYRHSDASVRIEVPAAATITASRRSLRNGQSVTFSGRLLGGPYPVPGKLVAVQAFYRGRWRTFATARADGRGRWRYAYRFGATRGVVIYRFRAQVRQEAAYPYLLGYSNTIAVRVSG